MDEYREQFSAGEVIFTEGDPSAKAYLLNEGQVRVVKRIGAIERSLRIVRAGELFGQSALLSGARRTSTAITLSPCSALAFRREDLPQLLGRHPDIGVTLCEQLVLRARRAEDRIEISMLRDAQSKVVLGLLRTAQLAALERKNGAEPLRLNISPLELSATVGLDVEAIKRAVQRLRENDYLRIVDEQVEIPDLEALQELQGLLRARDEIVGGDG